MTTLSVLSPSSSEFQWLEEKMSSTIKPHDTGRIKGYNILNIQKIDSIQQWRRYAKKRKQIAKENGGPANGMTEEEEKRRANERWLFHGTDKAGVILQRGFDVKHANPSGMFGPGLYFARDSSKSNQYVFGGMGGVCNAHHTRLCPSCERKMLVSRVCLGKQKEEMSAVSRSQAPPGYHSVKGVAGPNLRYSEFVVYENDQVCIRYLVSYKIVPGDNPDPECVVL